MADARCPASCGELLQGWILGGEKLISCPINWFSHVSVVEGQPTAHERPRMRAMVGAVMALLGLPAEMGRGLRIDYDSTIPVAKGMASSTADLAATAQATARHLGHEFDEKTLAALCVSLEPTDSTLFPQLTLFDHRHAQTQIPCHWQPELDIVVLESPHRLDTADYHRWDRHAHLQAGAPEMAQAWQLFRDAMAQHDLQRLGEATTLSARVSQRLLIKPAFAALLALVEQQGLYGLNVAHSGSVVGLLLDRRHHDVERLQALLHQPHIHHHYPRHHLLTMVPGGVR